MKNCLLVFIFLFSLLKGNTQTHFSNDFIRLQSKIVKTDFPDSLIQFASKALYIGKRDNIFFEEGYALLYLSRGYSQLADYESELSHLKQAYVCSRKSKDRILEGLVMLELGKCNQLTSEHAKGLDLMQRAKSIFEVLDYKEGIVRSNVYLAEYNRSLQKFPDALKHIRKALYIAQKLKIQNHLRIIMYNRAAAIQSETKDHDSSILYSKLAIDLSQRTGFINEKATSLNELGFIYENQQKFKQALENYSEAKEIWWKSKQIRNWVLVTENIARTYRKMGQFAKSNEIAFEAEKLAAERKWYSNLLSIYILIGGNYVLLDNMPKAKEYDHKAMGMKLINYQESNLRAIKEIKAKYEAEKKEALIRKKNQQIKISRGKIELEKKDKKLLFLGFIVLFVFMLLSVYIAFTRAWLLRELKSKSTEIVESNKKLNSALSKTEILLQEVHHRVKNNLQFITSIIELEIDANSNSSKKDSLKDISRRISSMSLVHELLYNSDDAKTIQSQKYVYDLVASINEMVNSERLPIDFDLKIDDFNFDVKQCIALGMIISELVSNSIKHAFKDQKNPLIRIHLLKSENIDKATLIVEDNGSGFTEDLSSKGLGSRLVYIFSIQLEGTPKFNTFNQFSYYLKFPISKNVSK